jgi:hypothetical protein
MVCLLGFSLKAQQPSRIQPGKLYSSGEQLDAPTLGFHATIPQGWSGMLPQGTELFMLMKEDGTNGQVIMAARENSDLNTLEQSWRKGGKLTESILLKSADEIFREGDLMHAEVVAEGERINPAYRGYIIAKCGQYGPCVSVLMITPKQYFEGIRTEVMEMMKSSSFSEPQDVNPYADFDWERFLSNKILVAYQQEAKGKRENTVDLCYDGTFQANIKRSGWLKDESGRYIGKLKGTWSVSGTGPETVLRMEFTKKNLDPIEVPMKIEEEKIYANGVRHYAGYSPKCD